MSRGDIQYIPRNMHTVFALLCFVVVIHWLFFPYPSGLLHWHCGNLTSASNATLMNMDEYFMWIHYERLHNHNKTKHNKTVCIFIGIYCSSKILLDYLIVLQMPSRVHSWGTGTSVHHILWSLSPQQGVHRVTKHILCGGVAIGHPAKLLLLAIWSLCSLR